MPLFLKAKTVVLFAGLTTKRLSVSSLLRTCTTNQELYYIRYTTKTPVTPPLTQQVQLISRTVQNVVLWSEGNDQKE